MGFITRIISKFKRKPKGLDKPLYLSPAKRALFMQRVRNLRKGMANDVAGRHTKPLPKLNNK